MNVQRQLNRVWGLIEGQSYHIDKDGRIVFDENYLALFKNSSRIQHLLETWVKSAHEKNDHPTS